MMAMDLRVDLCKDRTWLEAFRVGNHGALEKVYRCYAPLVFHVLRRGRATPGAAFVAEQQEEDVVQDVFLRLLSKGTRERYDGVRPFANLVVTITRNTLADHLRKQGRLPETRDPEMPGPDPLLQWHPGQALPDQALLTKEEAQLARELWATLDPQEQALAALRYQEGASQQECAVALGVSRQNLRTLEKRLRVKMDVFMAQRGIER